MTFKLRTSSTTWLSSSVDSSTSRRQTSSSSPVPLSRQAADVEESPSEGAGAEAGSSSGRPGECSVGTSSSFGLSNSAKWRGSSISTAPNPWARNLFPLGLLGHSVSTTSTSELLLLLSVWAFCLARTTGSSSPSESRIIISGGMCLIRELVLDEPTLTRRLGARLEEDASAFVKK